MNIDQLTYGEMKQIANIFNSEPTKSGGLNRMIGDKCIIRTYSAGVWFGEVAEKDGNEVIVKNARRMWRWFAAESVSLSAVAVHGINRDKSKIAPAVESAWLEAVELIPCTKEAIKSIEGAANVAAQ